MVESDTSIESPPTSQKLKPREGASAGSKDAVKQLKQICGHCCTGEDSLNIYSKLHVME